MFGKKKKEFLFEEEAETSEGQEPGYNDAAKAPAPKKTTSTRTLLLLLLLVLAGGGGYFMLMNEPAPPPPPSAPAPQRQAIPIVKPQPVAAVPAEGEPTRAATPVATESVAAEKPATEVAVAPTLATQPGAKATVDAALATTATAAPATATAAPATATAAPATATAAPATTTAPATAAPATVTTTALPVQKAPAAPAAGNFILATGAYADQGNVNKAQRSARQLGFQPTVTTVRHETTMTRLRYGVFRPEEASERLRELKKVAPAAFTLRQGELIAVYAGSFAVQNKARSFADSLYQQQILVEEEVVKVKVPLQQVTFGSFAERGAADQAALRARAAGMEVTVRARR